MTEKFEMLAFLFCKQGITYHVIIKEREFLFIDVVLYPIFIHTLPNTSLCVCIIWGSFSSFMTSLLRKIVLIRAQIVVPSFSTFTCGTLFLIAKSVLIVQK